VGIAGIEASHSEAPSDVVPHLLLDSYRCHMMASVMMQINKLGVKV